MGFPPQSSRLLPPQPLQIRWPLALLDPRHCRGLDADGDGLVNLALTVKGATITRIEPLPWTRAPQLPLALPAAVEPHCHLDKAFTWSQAPNPGGTISGALAANLLEHQSRSAAGVTDTINRALTAAWQQGYRALRSHLDLGWAGSQATWDQRRPLQRMGPGPAIVQQRGRLDREVIQDGFCRSPIPCSRSGGRSLWKLLSPSGFGLV